MKSGEMREVHLHEFHLRLSLTRGQTAFLLSAAFLALLTSPIATEQVTLSTYYPAPAGVYNNMVTIGNTWLARDNIPGTTTPSFVELGSNSPLSSGTKLAVMNGSVAIGTTTPQAVLDVSSGAQPQAKFGNGTDTVLINLQDIKNANWQINTGNYELGFYNAAKNAVMTLGNTGSPYSGNVGINTATPQAMLDVGSGYGYWNQLGGTIRINGQNTSMTYFGTGAFYNGFRNTGYYYFAGNSCSIPGAIAEDNYSNLYVCVGYDTFNYTWNPLHWGVNIAGSRYAGTIYSPSGNGWNFVTCPQGAFLTGMQISASDTWQGICATVTTTGWF